MKKDRIPDADGWLPLATAHLHVLISLGEQPRHGYAIMLDVRARTDERVKLWPASLYGAIRELVRDGLIEEAMAADDEDQRRQYYRLTRLGRRVLDAEGRRLDALARLARERARQS